MPLHTTEDPAEPHTLRPLDAIREDFLIFWASRDETGKPWCPDCIAVDNIIQNTFQPPTGPSALLVYVGQRPEWKSPSNPFRGEPWQVESIPTIIRLRDGARLVEKEIEHSLASFLKDKSY
ncbi:uncharacterized protein LAESUDRAFT_648851 [Laetiporus sulphureus 93-53]|uniref:Thioredoxin domain-containing protein n=1 Tax=Laetiporus sulphureus 93-53 TaxID=1314785 RepID=A0A165FA72_9APHY|nr:uncharacterized protein LAESUDRAFT_648851 [Laetiporus sulphureus 93-53]KZT08663.1 hypothetical protein LAESUDRAFT_648851 [Laetiporus sulphureus 93-53]